MPVSQNSRWKECVGMLLKARDRLVLAAFTIILALGGCIMGTVMGGIKGHTREAGIVDGAAKGGVTGAIAALQLLDDHHHPLSKLLLLSSVFNGKVLVEWAYPSYAYQWHIGTPEAIYREVSDNLIHNLPLHQFNSTKMSTLYNQSCCSICFQEFQEGEELRLLPRCDHIFHFHCIHNWLIQQPSCPFCRTSLASHFHQ